MTRDSAESEYDRYRAAILNIASTVSCMTIPDRPMSDTQLCMI